MIASKDIYWLAAICEGSRVDCRMTRNKNGVVFRIRVNNIETASRVASLVGGDVYTAKPSTKTGKFRFYIHTHGHRAIGWMMTLYSMVSTMLRFKFKLAIDGWRERCKSTYTANVARLSLNTRILSPVVPFI